MSCTFATLFNCYIAHQRPICDVIGIFLFRFAPCTEYTETRTVTSHNSKKPEWASLSYRSLEIPDNEFERDGAESKWQFRSKYKEYEAYESPNVAFSNRDDAQKMVFPHPLDREDLWNYGSHSSFHSNGFNSPQAKSENSRPNIFISAKNGSPVYVYAPGKVKNTAPRYVLDDDDMYSSGYADEYAGNEKPVENNSFDHYTEQYQQPALLPLDFSRSQNRDYESRYLEKPQLSSCKKVTFASPHPEEQEGSHFPEQAWTPHPPVKNSPNRSFTTYRNSFDASFRQEEVGVEHWLANWQMRFVLA